MPLLGHIVTVTGDVSVKHGMPVISADQAVLVTDKLIKHPFS